MDNYLIVLVIVLTHLTGLWIGYQAGKEETEELEKLRWVAEAAQKLHALDDLEEPWECSTCSPADPTVFNTVRKELYQALVEWEELENAT